MCGRFALTVTDTNKLQDRFDVSDVRVDQVQARYNIAPTQDILTVVADGEENRYLGAMRWGLIPFWHKDTSKLSGYINARSETVDSSNAFRNAFKKRRCLIVADGFYEWQKQEEGPKIPLFIHMTDHQPFGMAGLWERWQHPETGEVWTTCTILTTTPNEMMKPIHHRMPVILPTEDFARWLDPQADDTEALKMLLKPLPSEAMTAYSVSRSVNNVRNDDPSLIEPVSYD